MDDTEAFDIWRIVDVFRRRLRLIAASALFFLLLAGLLVMSMTSQYQASALVLVDQSGKNLLDPQQQALLPGSDTSRMDSEVEILRSDAIAAKVVAEHKLVENREFNNPRERLTSRILQVLKLKEPRLRSPDDDLQATLKEFHTRVTVQRVGATFLISVTAKSSDPALAAQLANAVAQTYIDTQVETKIQTMLTARDVLEKRIKLANTAVTTAEEALENFFSDNLDKITSGSGSAEVAQLRQKLLEANGRRQTLLANIETIQTKVGDQAWEDVARMLDSKAMLDLYKLRDAATVQLASATDGTPRFRDLRAELDGIERQLATQAQQGLTGLRQQVDTATENGAELRKQLRLSVVNADLPTDVLTQIYALQQASESKRTQFQTLISRLQDVEAQSDLQLADSRIVSQALKPSDPSSPNVKVILGISLFFGCFLGAGMALAYENFIGGFVDPRQVQSVLGVPTVVEVPVQTAPKAEKAGDISSAADLVISRPLSEFAECIRRVRVAIDQTNMSQAGADQKPGAAVIMFSSAEPEEGKTTLAVAFARACALAGQNTLLLDCDLRRPNVARLVNKNVKRGLQDYLLNPEQFRGSLASLAEVETHSRLRLILTKRGPQVPSSDLVLGNTFRELILSAKKTFDIIVLDTPPVEALVDGLRIAPLASHVVLVTKWASTPQQNVVRALESIRKANPSAHQLAILNQVQRAGFSKSTLYGGYHAYYEETPERAGSA